MKFLTAAEQSETACRRQPAGRSEAMANGADDADGKKETSLSVKSAQSAVKMSLVLFFMFDQAVASGVLGGWFSRSEADVQRRKRATEHPNPT